MHKRLIRLTSFTIFVALFLLSSQLKAQIEETGGYEDLLYQEVEVPNPVYMPVVGIGTGFIAYYGELQNDFSNLLSGRPSIRVNIYQPLGAKHNSRANIFFIWGKMSGEHTSYSQSDYLDRNVNFESDLINIGINWEYNFGHLFKGEKRIRPFMSLGVEYVIFDTKSDIFDANGLAYDYQPDGTIRNQEGIIITRDYEYETPYSDLLTKYGRSEAPAQSTAAAVMDLGFDLSMGKRVSFRLGTSLHYPLSFDGKNSGDDFDMISSNNTNSWVGNSQPDMFAMTYCSFNFDLFSSPETLINELLFASLDGGEFDQFLIGDNDRDEIMNIMDNCPETPKGVAVDSVGCPLDQDKDGVPDYLDKEFFTKSGAIVDENGVEMHPDKILATMQDLNVDAVNRDEQYMIPITLSAWTKYSETGEVTIPPKFITLDKDKDNYISFDELMDAIDAFFDEGNNYSTEDIYELNEFFFSQ